MVFVFIDTSWSRSAMVEHYAPVVPVKVAIRKRTKFVIDELLGGSRASRATGTTARPRRRRDQDARARRPRAEGSALSGCCATTTTSTLSATSATAGRPVSTRVHRDLVAAARSSSSSSLVREVQCRRVGDVGGLNDDASDRSLSFGSN